MLNTLTLQGNLTKDPESRTAENGTTYVRFSIAYNAPPRKGQEKGEVSFFDCVAFGRTGEIVAQHCQKGKQIIVVGRVEQRRWTDDDGANRSSFGVVVDPNGVHFVSDGRGRDGEGGAPAARSGAATPANAPAGSGGYEDDTPF